MARVTTPAKPAPAPDAPSTPPRPALSHRSASGPVLTSGSSSLTPKSAAAEGGSHSDDKFAMSKSNTSTVGTTSKSWTRSALSPFSFLESL